MIKTEHNLVEVELSTSNSKSKKKRSLKFKGIPVVAGIALGNAVVVQEHNFIISHEKIQPEQVNEEIEKFNNAIDELYNQYKLSLDTFGKQDKKEFGIFEAYLLIIKDPFINESIVNRIKNLSNVEFAVAQEYDYQRSLIKNSSDPILKERANELNIIKEDLLATLRNTCTIIPNVDKAVIVAHSLKPADIAQLKSDGIQGIITEVGGVTSHASIIARSYNIPAIVGVKEITKQVQNNDFIILDGYEGTITTNPSQDSIKKYKIKKDKEEQRKKRFGALVHLPTKTRDGKIIKLYANVSDSEDVDRAIENGAEGIGLVRTEMNLYKEKKLFETRDLTKIYKEIAEKSYPNIVTFRVFDIGSDKYPLIINRQETNPALGLRGIRYLLTNKNLFRTQVKAILKASVNKNTQILLPMISSLSELKESLKIIEECKKSLEKEKRQFNPFIPVGIMIETPASALLANEFAKYCDFFSIGTNDLTQYTLAADRNSELVANYFDEFNPAVLKLIKMSVEAGKRRGIPITVCGDLARDPSAISLFIGLGVDALSVDPHSILQVKHKIRDSFFSECVKFVEEKYSTIS